MKYHYEKTDKDQSRYGQLYICDHAVYNKCTLFVINQRGLAVIQQRYDPTNKHTYWGEVDNYIVDDIYLHPQFEEYFDKRARVPIDGIYPTVTLRQLMWALRIKPLKREQWETVFDRINI